MPPFPRACHNYVCMNINIIVDYIYIYLLCMIRVRFRWCTCSLWRMYRPVDFVLSPPPLKTNKRNDLTRPVMGTIFLVIYHAKS